MALLEDRNLCCICNEHETSRSYNGIPAYYCNGCFAPHREDILNRAPWLNYLMNEERQRRKRRNRLLSAGAVMTPIYSCDRVVGFKARY